MTGPRHTPTTCGIRWGDNRCELPTRHGGPHKPSNASTLGDLFWTKVQKTETCWLWTGPTNSGYGQWTSKGRTHRVHRSSYEALVGPIPAGMVLDHLCRVRNCINPDHLEPVSHAVNILRGTGIAATNTRKTHCQNGHAFDTANTRLEKGHRRCRTCDQARNRARAQDRKRARAARKNVA